jgi:anti-sigma regulatory factor (Ser/Thr protein kinase)
MRATRRIEIADTTQVAEARRTAIELAGGLGLAAREIDRAALVATEAASNVLKHAGRGELLLCAHPGASPLLEMLILDAGPGFDASRAGVDGYSTAGTLGVGLGALRRLSSELQIYSPPGGGSLVRIAIAADDAPASSAAFEVGAISLPHPGETVCGDTFAYRLDGDRGLFVIADGLGHGSEARRASARVIEDLPPASEPPARLLERAHAALHATRGAAVGVTVIDLAAGQACHAGIGNIATRIFDASGVKNMVSLPGIVGHNVRKLQSFDHPFGPHSLLVMHSDGLGTRWQLDAYPGLQAQHPSIIAAVLYRDHARGSDDVSVLVAGVAPGAGRARGARMAHAAGRDAA